MPRDSSLKPRKIPRQRRARETVAAILEGAAQVFDREGYARTTTDRIAERAGVSIGSLYQYFPGKDAILVALAEQHLQAGLELVQRMLAALGGDPSKIPLDALLTGFVEALIELHQKNPRLQRMLLAEAPMPPDHHPQMSAREDELAAEVQAVLTAHPAVRVADPALAAWLLVHAAHGLIHDYVVHPPPGDVDRGRFVSELVSLLGRYLEAR